MSRWSWERITDEAASGWATLPEAIGDRPLPIQVQMRDDLGILRTHFDDPDNKVITIMALEGDVFRTRMFGGWVGGNRRVWRLPP